MSSRTFTTYHQN